MPFSARIKDVGGMDITVQATDNKDLIRQVSFFTSLPKKCATCGGEHLGFNYKKTQQGYEYYSLDCLNQQCGYQFKFGQLQADNSLYTKGWEPPFTGEQGQQGGQPQQQQAPPPQQQGAYNPPPQQQAPQMTTEQYQQQQAAMAGAVEDDEIPF